MQLIHTDGSCLGNPGPGGFAVILEDGTSISRGYRRTTNNRMELMALLFALKETEGPILVRSDSKYVVDSATKWIDGWIAKGWRGVKNADLWRLFLEIRRPFEIEWVRGHAGHPLNELADRRANEAAGLPQNVDRGFEDGAGDAKSWIW